MVWKRKEKDLTHDQVLSMTKQELAPDWYNSAMPLLVGVDFEGQTSVHPLDPSFTETAWVFVAIDPFSNEGHLAMEYVREWAIRYEGHGVRVLVAFPEVSDVFDDRRFMETFLDDRSLRIPTFVDRGALVCRGLGVQMVPSLAFVTKAGVLFRHTGPNWFHEAEAEIQAYLRKRDPGLSLALPFAVPDPSRDLHRCDFGKDPAALPRSIALPTAIGAFEVGLKGEWRHEAQYIVTSDPLAELTFPLTTQGFSLFARSMSKVLERARVVAEFEGAPIYDVFSWQDLTYDDTGRSVVEIRDARLYRIAHHFKSQGTVTLRFPNAVNLPVAIYSLLLS